MLLIDKVLCGVAFIAHMDVYISVPGVSANLNVNKNNKMYRI